MSSAKKIMIFAASLMITVGLIFISFDIYDDTKEAANIIKNNTAVKVQQMQEEHITKYEYSFISGAMVVSYVKEIYEDVSSIIITPQGRGSYDAKNVPEITLYQNMKTMAHSYYVDPLSDFYVVVTRNDNGIITTVTITEQNQ